MWPFAGVGDEHAASIATASPNLLGTKITLLPNSDKSEGDFDTLEGGDMRLAQGTFRAAAAVGFIALASYWSSASAQAWVGPQGSLDLGLDYNFAKSDKVVGDAGLKFPDAGSTTHQETISVEYVPIDRLGIGLSLPLASFEYTGSKTLYPHPGGGTYDDGSFHTTFTDLRGGARYQVLADPIAISPIIELSLPIANYETVGNTVAGRHLDALHLGLAIGKIIDAFYVQALYEFSIVQKYDRTADTAKQGQNTSDGSLVIGYKLFDHRFDLNLDANFHITHGGIDFSTFGSNPQSDQLYHDAILREDQLLLGGGLGYQINDSLTVAAKYMVFVSGVNTQNASVLAVGLAYSPL